MIQIYEFQNNNPLSPEYTDNFKYFHTKITLG